MQRHPIKKIARGLRSSAGFTMDANFDGDDDDTFEDITYAFNSVNGRLMQINPPLDPEVLIDNVTSLNFTYLDTDDQTTNDLNEIRSVDCLFDNATAGRS